MTSLEWSDEYSVGSDEMDEQHKKLISTINDLEKGVNSGITLASMINAIQEMKDYSVFHFSSEEALMETVSYPDLMEHKQEHQDFIEKVDKLKNDFANLMEGNPDNIMEFLKYWWKNHILIEDKKYSEYLS